MQWTSLNHNFSPQRTAKLPFRSLKAQSKVAHAVIDLDVSPQQPRKRGAGLEEEALAEVSNKPHELNSHSCLQQGEKALPAVCIEVEDDSSGENEPLLSLLDQGGSLPARAVPNSQKGSGRAKVRRPKRQKVVRAPPPEPTLAAAAASTTHAFTVQGAQLALAMLTGRKMLENRSFKLRIGWYALHVGCKRDTECGLRAARMYQDLPRDQSLEDHFGSIIGLLYISEHRLPSQCNGDSWALGPKCNVISHSVLFPRPLRQQGRQGIWPLSAEMREGFAQLVLQSCHLTTHDTSALGPMTAAEQSPQEVMSPTSSQAGAQSMTPSSAALGPMSAAEQSLHENTPPHLPPRSALLQRLASRFPHLQPSGSMSELGQVAT